MPRSTIDFDTVRNIGLALPGVEESTAYGLPALKVQGKLLACVPANPSAEPGSIVVRVDFDDRAELLAAAPDVYYLTDHYLDSPAPFWFAYLASIPMCYGTSLAWPTNLSLPTWYAVRHRGSVVTSDSESVRERCLRTKLYLVGEIAMLRQLNPPVR